MQVLWSVTFDSELVDMCWKTRQAVTNERTARDKEFLCPPAPWQCRFLTLRVFDARPRLRTKPARTGVIRRNRALEDTTMVTGCSPSIRGSAGSSNPILDERRASAGSAANRRIWAAFRLRADHQEAKSEANGLSTRLYHFKPLLKCSGRPGWTLISDELPTMIIYNKYILYLNSSSVVSM